ncbi:translation initiation factor IF-2 [Candidatus Peribacteria bacterium RIFCSPHIGHO2_01_FULL_51_9]|nr:MAG: translation initiation factor IF-2 [Candidatus Peribacteria bacterium RIFCSPHIGHO2_01_FULL_51_9]
MRLVQVAKVLGMTGQELRKELLEVDFGVKPTDREVPDTLAQGIVRFVSRKHGLTVDMSIFGEGPEVNETVTEKEETEAPAKEGADVEKVQPQKGVTKRSELHVLRKLTLEGVSKEDIARQKEQEGGGEVSRKEREELLREAQSQGGIVQSKKSAATQLQEQIKKKEGVVDLPEEISVKEFAEKTGIQVPKIIQTLMKNGVMATVNQGIDYDTAAIVASELGVQVRKAEAGARVEELFAGNLEELLKDEPENLRPRAPVVVVMGHVDHGKTAILDAIRETDVVSGEAGGITQHIGAYQVEHHGKPITFLDTPGHEAFTAMRARGAQVTDIAVIVVSAEEGVKATTIEAIHHAKEAGVPVIVAINKIDKEAADIDRVKGEVAAQGLQPEEWGGDTPFVLCSAKTKKGIPELLDAVLLSAEMQELKANPNRRAVATVIESHIDTAHGPLATVIVNAGTLHVGDIFVCGVTTGKVRAMMDAHGERIEEVIPSGPARIAGFQDVPRVGDILQIFPSEREARAVQEEMLDRGFGQKKRNLSDLVSRLFEGKIRHLKIVLKADMQGSLEAIESSLQKKETVEVSPKIIHGGIGAVSETDVMLASASDGIVIAFHVPVPIEVRKTAERDGVTIREYDIIYKLFEEIDDLLKGLLEPEEKETISGHLEVLGVFYAKRNEQIIGGRVADGIIKRLQFRLFREQKEVGTGRITSLKKVDKDIKEAKEGTECGMRVESSIPIVVGDRLEVFVREFKKKGK